MKPEEPVAKIISIDTVRTVYLACGVGLMGRQKIADECVASGLG